MIFVTLFVCFVALAVVVVIRRNKNINNSNYDGDFSGTVSFSEKPFASIKKTSYKG